MSTNEIVKSIGNYDCELKKNAPNYSLTITNKLVKNIITIVNAIGRFY
jgi:hypothetical protein